MLIIEKKRFWLNALQVSYLEQTQRENGISSENKNGIDEIDEENMQMYQQETENSYGIEIQHPKTKANKMKLHVYAAEPKLRNVFKILSKVSATKQVDTATTNL